VFLLESSGTMQNNAMVPSFSTCTDPSQAGVYMRICTDGYKYKPQSLARHSQRSCYGNAGVFPVSHIVAYLRG